MAIDPVCGMKVNPATAKFTYEHEAKKYYFCSAGCREKFKTAPQKFLNAVPLSAQGIPPKPVGDSGLVMLGTPAAKTTGDGRAAAVTKDPVCGMNVDPAKTAFKTQYNGKEYFFCCKGCREKFQANPEKILSAPPKPMS